MALADQDRSRWNAAQIKEGLSLLNGVLGAGPAGSYQLQAAIAAVHDEAADARMASSHRLESVRANFLERAGETAAARDAYLRAARMNASLPEQRYLALQAARLRERDPGHGDPAPPPTG